MSKPVPDELHARFDFIFDGSSLDNIFNPAQALQNMSRMLRPGGRLLITEHGTLFAGAYPAFSPGWFFDFFAANKYRDCKVYVGAFSDDQTLRFGPWSLRVYNWIREKNGVTPRNTPGRELMLVVIAEKDEDSTDTALPVQFQYRDSAYQRSVFFPNVERILRSERPVFSAPFGGTGATIQQSPKTYVACLDLSADAPF